MSKCIVKTTGPFMLLTPEGVSIKKSVETVVPKSNFVASRIAKGDLKVLADGLPDSVTQEDLAKAGSVEALLESLKEPSETSKTPKKKAD